MRIVVSWLFSFSRFGLLIAITFIALALAFRVTLPFGDEPDFTVRALELVENEFPMWTPYYWMSSGLQQLNVYSNCTIVASPTEVTAHIHSASCEEGGSQVLLRTLFMVCLASPVLLLVAWRGLGYGLLGATVKGSPDELKRRIDALGLSLLMPGMIYYLGLLSHEQLTLLISLFIFFFWGNRLIVAVLLCLIGSLDLGNAVIVVAFILAHTIITLAIAKLGIKLVVISLAALFGYAYLHGVEGFTYIGFFPMFEFKINSIMEKSRYTDFFDKYPLILRPIITFMTGTFMTPSGVKILPLYVIYGVSFLVMVNRLRLHYLRGDRSVLPVLLAVFTTTIFFAIILPNYTNAKYYMFLTPFILDLALKVFRRKWIFIILVATSLMVPMGLILFTV